ERSGYRLALVATRPDFQKAWETQHKSAEFMYSIGFSVSNEGAVTEVNWDGPAFNQGLTVGTKIVAVNGEPYDADTLRRIITDAKTDTHPIDLLVQTGDSRYRTIAVDYHGGLRYPHLERVAHTPDRLGQILTPR